MSLLRKTQRPDPTNPPVRQKSMLAKKSEGYKKSSDTAKKSAKIGNLFEGRIMEVCDLYKSMEKAWIQKNATPTAWVPGRPAQPGGKPTGGFLVHAKKHGFDFAGAYRDPDGGWRPIFFEAKSTLEGRIEIQEKAGIKLHQLSELLWLEQRGLTAFVLWEIRAAGAIYMFPASEVMAATNGLQDRKYIDLEDCHDRKWTKVPLIDYKGRAYADILGYLLEAPTLDLFSQSPNA